MSASDPSEICRGDKACGREIPAGQEYRCLDCDAVMHKDCLRWHCGADEKDRAIYRLEGIQRKAVQRLSDALLLALDGLDSAVGPRKDVPDDIGRWLGNFANTLDMENDRVRFFVLGVNFRTDDKARAVAKLRKLHALPAPAEVSYGR